MAPLPPLTIDLEDDEAPPTDDDEPLQLAAEADQYRFGHSCPLCGTRMDFVSSQIGQSTSCPDCFTVFTIPTPGPRQERRPLSEDGFGAPDRLDMAAAPEDTRRLDSPDALKEKADLLLRKAAEDLAASQREEHAGQFSDATATSLFQFLVAPTTVARLVILALVGIPGFAILATSTGALQAEGGEGMSAAIRFAASVPFLMVWFALLAAHGLALLRETSAQLGPVENWPGANPFEWLADPFQLGLALLISSIPGFLASSLLVSVGLGGLLAGVAVPLSITVFLPLVLLSMLHEQSLLAIFSRDIWNGLSSFRSEVVTFYQAAALLGIILWMTLMMSWMGSTLIALVQPAVITLATILYFRLLGWLARSLLTDDE